jgi:hypothetical protein
MMSVACGRPTHHQMAIYAEKSGGEAGCGAGAGGEAGCGAGAGQRGRRGGAGAGQRGRRAVRAPGSAGAGRCAPGGGLAALYGGAEEA